MDAINHADLLEIRKVLAERGTELTPDRVSELLRFRLNQIRVAMGMVGILLTDSDEEILVWLSSTPLADNGDNDGR